MVDFKEFFLSPDENHSYLDTSLGVKKSFKINGLAVSVELVI